MQLDLFSPPTDNVTVYDPEPSGSAVDITPSRNVGCGQPVQPTVSHKAVLSGASPKNLAEALAHYGEGVSTHPTRVKIRSAFRSVERVLQRPLDQIPADPKALGPLLGAANCAAGGIKPRQWGEVKSLVNRGLRDLGMDIVAVRDETVLSAEWEALLNPLDRRLQIALAKFMRFCTRSDIAPGDVCEATFEAFLNELRERTLHAKPMAAYRQTAKFWNRALAEQEAWPRVAMPEKHDERQYALVWEAFPSSFNEDVLAFLATKEFGDEFAEDYSPRVRKSTTKNRREAIRRVASALVLSGKPVEEIESLRELCKIENVRTALRFLRARHADQRVTEGDLNHIWVLRVIARYWVKDEAATKAIIKLASAVGPDIESRRGGMRPKNRELLRQFDQPDNFVALVDLPQKTLKRIARKTESSYNDAVQVMYALQVAILLHAPMRSKNLAELELGHHLIDFGKASRRTVRIHLPEDKVKNYKSYDAPLPAHVFPLLDAWLKVYRPLICPTPSRYLFPNSKGELRSRDSLAAQVPKFLKRETGLEMHLHLFRHLAAKILLDRDPNCIELVRQCLGHTTTRTTERAYAELRTDPAFLALDAGLREIMEKPIMRAPRSKGGRR